MRVVSFDFETKDPYIKRKFGAGWVYKYHNYQNCDFEVLGMSYADGKESGYVTDVEDIRTIISSADILVAHNASYDLGCLMALGLEDLVNSVYGRTICTVLSSKLVDSSQMAYSLDWLSKKWLKNTKQGSEMYQEVWDKHIFPLTKIEEKSGRADTIPDNKKSRVKNWTMENLDIVQSLDKEIVARYAIADSEVCLELLEHCREEGSKYYKNPLDVFCHWTKLVHICQDYTKRGIRVDMKKIDEATQWLQPKITKGLNEISSAVGFEFNIMSSHALPKVFQELGLKTGTSPSGRPSVTKELLEVEQHPVAQLIRDTKQYMNIKNNFIGKMGEIQQYTMKQGEREDRDYGRVHPQYTPMGAKTGRFSCNGPNLQQIPKRNKELGQWCRGIFVPEKDTQWYSLDFSNQEGRLQAHYASLASCDGGDLLTMEFNRNPKYDLHQEVADICGISRTDAKVINLGLSYGMGQGKLCKTLGLPTRTIKNKQGKEIEIAGRAGEDILTRYSELFPFLKQLIDKVTKSATLNKYIRTVGGRAVTNDRAIIDGRMVLFTHKAFNQLIQGSAFDQTALCMIAAYEKGLPVMLTIHDELNLSGSLEEAYKLKKIMEHTLKLELPSVTDIGLGSNWWDAC